jgi:hypothetical protein
MHHGTRRALFKSGAFFVFVDIPLVPALTREK